VLEVELLVRHALVGVAVDVHRQTWRPVCARRVRRRSGRVRALDQDGRSRAGASSAERRRDDAPWGRLN
jgi:hypothetical protein